MKIKNKAIYIIVVVIVIVGLLIYHKLYSDSKYGKSLAKLTVVVTDEDGNVIPDADTSVTFDLMAGWTESRSYTKRGKSNEQGEFSATHRTLDKVFVGARKKVITIAINKLSLKIQKVYTGNRGTLG